MLDVCFTHNGTTTTSLAVTVDNSALGTFALNSLGGHVEAVSGMRSYKTKLGDANAQHTVKLTHNRGSGVSGRLDYLRLSYMRPNALSVPIYATAAGESVFLVNGANEHTVVWNITDPASPAPVASTLQGSKLTFMADVQWGDVFLAFDTQASYPMPEVVGEVPNQNLHATEATDYVIIVPASGKLTAQAERLADVHRTRSGLRVKVVRADEVFNEFSSGTPDATAYRRYLKMLYDRAATVDEAPKYLLLFGDGAWDNRMLSPAWKGKSPDDYLLCFEAENSYSATSSYVMEDYYGLLDDNEGGSLLSDKVDIGVGRFPVTTMLQARDVVDKVIAYMDNADAGAW